MPAPPNRRMSLWDRPGAAGKLAMSRAHAFGADLGTDTGAVGALIPDFETWFDPANLGSAYSGAGALPVTKGGTGAPTAPAARISLGLRGPRGPDALNLVATGGGGTSTITFAAATGYPGIESFPLTGRADGTSWIEADLVDRAGGLLERGWYRVNPTARTLARNKLFLTGNGAASVVEAGAATGPSAVSIPDGSEIHFRIFGDVATLESAFRAQWTGGGALGRVSPIFAGLVDGPIATGYHYYSPYPWPGGFVRTAGLYVGTQVASTAANWALFEGATSGTGGPGSSLVNANSDAALFAWIATTAAGEASVTVRKFFARQLLWTVVAFSSGSLRVMTSTGALPHPWGTVGGLPVAHVFKAQAWTGADIPATAPTAFDGISASGSPALYLMPG